MTRNTRKPRSYCYRIPLDDTAALLRLRRFERKSEYFIHELSNSEVPNVNAAKNWACVFYRSKETRGNYLDEFEGGAIPGLEEYRHSLDWKPTPETELLEMKRHHKGGTQIRGQQFLGTHDPRISDYVKVETTVPWTPSEIEAMFDGKPVPDRENYTHKPPEISSKEARRRYRRLIEVAMQDSFEEAREALWEYEQQCNHDHAIETKRGGYCENCGREWHDECEMKRDEAVIVGTE
jgi:hypothetical protein